MAFSIPELTLTRACVSETDVCIYIYTSRAPVDITKGGARFTCPIETIGDSIHLSSLTKNKCILKLLVRSVDPNKYSETLLKGKAKIVDTYHLGF